MKHRFIKLIFKLIIIISVFETFYLLVIPAIIHKFITKEFICSLVQKNTNINLNAENILLKTKITPTITVSAKNISAKNKLNNSLLLSADNIGIEISIFHLLFKEIQPRLFYADNLQINISQDKNGIFNFEQLIKSNNKSTFKIKLINTDIKASGAIKIKNNSSDFDVNILYSEPFSYKDFSTNHIKGDVFIYKINLKEILPLLKYINPNTDITDGFIEYIQISADENNKNNTQVVLNAKFNNILYHQKDWINSIYAKNENKLSSTLELFKNTIDVKHLKYDAENIHISADGKIELRKQPYLDINVSVMNSKTEDIANILPPNISKENQLFEKIKTYGIYGDIEGKANIKGIVPRPEITGFVKGRDIHILDKEMHKKHKGTVDLTFDKKKLNMDILLEMPNKQNAKISGYTYMYREGTNNVTIKTTPKIDFSLAHKLLIPISKVFDFQLGPLPDMNISKGFGNIDLNIKGSIDIVDLKGNCFFENADLTYNGLYGKVTNASGKINFDRNNIIVKADNVFLQNNLFSLDGVVKVNNNLNFNLYANNANADKIFEIINKSELLKDLKKGLSLFNCVNGLIDLKTNISAKIVPVEYGMPPLPPEEAFKDLKVNGNIQLKNIESYITGFNTPVNNVKGIVNFTETTVDFSDIKAEICTSPINIQGKIFTDTISKIPDINLLIKSNSVKIGDSIRFLSDSSLYPKNYPNISSLYSLDVIHDLYLEYKAKSKDFLTNKIYAVINIQKEHNDHIIKGNSGRIILNKANVKVDNVNADIFDSNINFNGSVNSIDTKNPVYNIIVSSDKFNLENLNRVDELSILPNEMTDLLSKFTNYKGYLDFSTDFKNNILKTKAEFSNLSFIEKNNSVPVKFDDFMLEINQDKISADNITGNIGDMPFFANIKADNIYAIPYLDAYFTSKINNSIIKNYMPEYISDKISLSGEIDLSAFIKGTANDFYIAPKITLYPDADAVISGVSIGDSADKRVFSSNIGVNSEQINIENLDYYKYITTQNNTVYPALFAHGSGILSKTSDSEQYNVKTAHIKTEKSLSAKLLNIFLNKPLFKQGTIICNLKYDNDKISGEMNARNIDIPIFDTVIKNIKLETDNDNINVRMFGFVNDTVVRVKTSIDNNINKIPHFNSLNISADKIDLNKLLNSIANARKEYNSMKEENKSPDLSFFQIENGDLHIDSLTIKNYLAENIDSKFSINKDGIFNLNDINVKLGEGSATGELLYDLRNTDISASLDFKNVDANNLAENLLDAEDQIYGVANANFFIKSSGNSDEELLKNLSGFAYFDMADGKMPKLGSLEYLLRASNIIKSGVTAFSINNVLEILNLVKTGYFTGINGNCKIEQGIAKDIEIFSQGENLSLYIHGDYNIVTSNANMEILGKLSNRISTIFGPIGNASLNTFFKHIPGISLLDFTKKDFIENVEKIPSFTGGNYESRTFQAIINGDINSSGYVQSFKWVK